MDEYYFKQAGSGIGGYVGTRYQKGDGFFGRFITGSVLPLIKKVLPYLGRTALTAGADIMGDLSEGQKFTDSFKNRLQETGEKINRTAMAKVRQMTGEGRRKRRKKATAKPTKVTSKRKAKAKKKQPKSKRAKDFL